MLVFISYLIVLLTCVLIVFYAERKLSAFAQDRLGPTEVGYYGLLQALADLAKLIQKEDIVPQAADRKLFLAAPLVIFMVIFTGYAVMPFTPSVVPASIQTGVFFLLAIVSLDVVGLMMAGWGSNSKYSLYGAMRAVAQIVSYEIPVGLSILSVVMLCQTMDLQAICYQQGIWINRYPTLQTETNYLFGITSIDVTHMGGFLTWNVFRMPLFFVTYIIFYIATLAECNRAPFDLPEGESELVGGFHTEYSGFRWALFFLAEYAIMLLVSALGVILFLGGWNTPLPNMGPVALADWTSGAPGTLYGNVSGAFWLLVKTLLVVATQIFARWTYPRLRIDQLMYLCWKVLTPAALLILLITGIWRLLM